MSTNQFAPSKLDLHHQCQTRQGHTGKIQYCGSSRSPPSPPGMRPFRGVPEIEPSAPRQEPFVTPSSEAQIRKVLSQIQSRLSILEGTASASQDGHSATSLEPSSSVPYLDPGTPSADLFSQIRSRISALKSNAASVSQHGLQASLPDESQSIPGSIMSYSASVDRHASVHPSNALHAPHSGLSTPSGIPSLSAERQDILDRAGELLQLSDLFPGICEQASGGARPDTRASDSSSGLAGFESAMGV